MKEVMLMKDQKRRKYFLLVTFLFIFILYLGNEYVFTPNSYDGDSYISQFLLSTETTTLEPTEDNSSIHSSKVQDLINIIKVESPKKMHSTNMTITIIRTGNSETMIKVKYSESPETNKTHTKSIFVELKDINKTTDNIFFIETRCATEKMAQNFKNSKGFVLNARQCCAVESTALMNLHRNVYVFHSCPLSHDFLDQSPKFVMKLLSYPNVYVVKLNTTEAFQGTPLEELQSKKLLETSSYPVEHTSDLLRLTLLWKFGGTYCDLDVVTIKSLNALKTNWAGMQDGDTIANGVLNFEPEGPGHDMLRRALEHVNKHYDGAGWSSNGPLLITPIILQECKVRTVPEASAHCNGNFTVFNSSVLYPLYYSSAGDFFNDALGKGIVRSAKSKAYSVHIWNKISHDMVGKVGSTQAYALLANEFCPQVYQNCGTNF